MTSDIPFVPHVATSRLEALEHRLEEMSRLSVDFLVMLTASTAIATLGLFLNSPAVIIGAMIIAPLIRPLTGLSLACLTADLLLLQRALLTLVTGTALGGCIACLLASLLSGIELTPEILARTRPNLIDLGVAMIAGAVGAYCQTKEELADTLAGVAIAVALVPPLGVAGIGLARLDANVWTGAALLYATNLVGISVAGAIVFLLLGYSPLRQARTGLLISGALVCILVLPLGLSMRELVLENTLSKTIKQALKAKTHTFQSHHLQSIEVRRFHKPTIVTATVLGSGEPVSAKQVRLLQDFLENETGIPLQFRLRIVPATEIGAVELAPTSASPTVPSSVPADRSSSTEAASKRAGAPAGGALEAASQSAAVAESAALGEDGKQAPGTNPHGQQFGYTGTRRQAVRPANQVPSTGEFASQHSNERADRPAATFERTGNGR